MTAAEKDRRRRELAKIHIGAKQICDDDGAYREMLQVVTGKRSAGDLDAAGRRTVIRHLESCGVKFERPRREAPRPKPRPEIRKQLRLIDALCINHPGGRKPRAWAEGILRQSTRARHRTPLEWATLGQLQEVQQMIRADIRRHGIRARGAA